MSPMDEKSSSEPTVNVLTIEQPAATLSPTDRTSALSASKDTDSTHSSEKNPLSPFYSHPTTRYSLDAHKTHSNQNMSFSENNDVEACLTQEQTKGSMLKTFTTTKECTVWPGQGAMRRKKKAMKAARQRTGLCGCMAGYSKRTRIFIKLVVALLVIGIAIGVGVGISKSVGGGIWGDH
ncbi:hypothetical protein PVAG01_01787 [Phlyctema vagabunda]|uniref:Uncharacterized protein n=1 Tax=Phlyctema vagabunda TaxID=108571 RepID=A0ABR4PY30_9HELO